MNWFIPAVAAGRSLGSAARYLVSIGFGRLLGSKLPWGTLFIDITGSLLIGLFAGLFAMRWICIFLTVGICGGYTASNILTPFLLPVRARRVAAAGACMIASVVLAVSALIAGIQIVRPL